MYPMMDPKKSKPLSEEEGVKKMTQIGAIMQQAGMDFGEDDMRLLRDAYMGQNAYEEQMEALIARYSGDTDWEQEVEEQLAGSDAEEPDDDDEAIDFSELG